MARSSLIAGGCATPTEGNLPSGHSSVKTAISADGSAMSARCTAFLSPHSPSNVARASTSSRVASRQPSLVTMTRGHGRCASALRPFLAISVNAVIVLPIREALPPPGTRRPTWRGDRCRLPAPARDARTSECKST